MMIFLAGENDYAIKRQLEILRSDFLANHDASAVERYDGENLGKEQLPDLLRGSSLFSSERLIIVDRPSVNKEVIEALADQAETVEDSTTLVVVEPQADKRTAWYKKLSKIKGAKLSVNLNAGQLSRWLVDEAKARGGQLDLATANYLVERVGEDQWRLSTELDKLTVAGKKIERGSIEQMVEPSVNQSVFNLVELVMAGRVKEAQSLYDRLRLSEVEPQQFIGLLAWQLNAMLIVKSAGSRSPSEIASKSGLSSFVISKSAHLVRRLKLAQLGKLIDLTLAADLETKMTGTDADRRLKLLIGQFSQVISS